MAEKNLKYEIINHIGTLSASAKGWTVELNRVSWNSDEPKYDLRSWSPDHSRPGKGLTLTEDQLMKLAELLEKEAAFLKED